MQATISVDHKEHYSVRLIPGPEKPQPTQHMVLSASRSTPCEEAPMVVEIGRVPDVTVSAALGVDVLHNLDLGRDGTFGAPRGASVYDRRMFGLNLSNLLPVMLSSRNGTTMLQSWPS